MNGQHPVSIEIGTSFTYFDEREGGHLHFVASDVTQPAVVLLNFTSVVRWSDLSCTLNVGDHPFITHQTCIAYDHADLVDVSTLQRRLANGELVPHQTVSNALLEKVWDGAGRTKQLPGDCKSVLKAQFLI